MSLLSLSEPLVSLLFEVHSSSLVGVASHEGVASLEGVVSLEVGATVVCGSVVGFRGSGL